MTEGSEEARLRPMLESNTGKAARMTWTQSREYSGDVTILRDDVTVARMHAAIDTGHYAQQTNGDVLVFDGPSHVPKSSTIAIVRDVEDEDWSGLEDICIEEEGERDE